MAKQTFVIELLKRNILRIIGSYLIAGTSLVLFIDWLIARYQLPEYYVSIALFCLISIIPSVIILAYFHGAPGKDEWTKIEKYGITINVLAMSVVENSGMAKDITENIIVEILDKTISKSKLDHDDITHTIDFLIRRESKMITGQILNLGGF